MHKRNNLLDMFIDVMNLLSNVCNSAAKLGRTDCSWKSVVQLSNQLGSTFKSRLGLTEDSRTTDSMFKLAPSGRA